VSYDDLPPTQQLVLECLAARYRTGETTWTLSRKARLAATKLAALGLVWWKHGVLERTILVGLTDDGIQEMLGPTYVSPLDRLRSEQPTHCEYGHPAVHRLTEGL